MLELRPSCEHCRTALPADSAMARICSFECTFCADCVALLHHVCPNCGGNFAARPIRPAHGGKDGNDLQQHPAGQREVYRPVDLAAHARWVAGMAKR